MGKCWTRLAKTDKYNDLQARSWKLIAYKNLVGCHICSPTSQSNSAEHEKGDSGNFQLCVDPKFSNSECFWTIVDD